MNLITREQQDRVTLMIIFHKKIANIKNVWAKPHQKIINWLSVRYVRMPIIGSVHNNSLRFHKWLMNLCVLNAKYSLEIIKEGK